MRPERGIVEILSRHDDTPVGLGFLAGDRQVLTCAHVVNSALGRAEQDSSRPDKRVLLRYPFRTARHPAGHGEPGRDGGHLGPDDRAADSPPFP